LTAQQEGSEIPIQVIGLPKDDVETRKAEMKFARSVESFSLVHPDIVEARAIVKTSLLEKERRRYEVRVLIRLSKEQIDLVDEGWSVEEIFENIHVKLKRFMTKPRDKPAHHPHPSRAEMEAERFEE
jgi:hypothetical protein